MSSLTVMNYIAENYDFNCFGFDGCSLTNFITKGAQDKSRHQPTFALNNNLNKILACTLYTCK